MVTPAVSRRLERGTTPLPSLTSLRALAAGAVFAYHLEFTGTVSPGGWLRHGYVGVGFFFVLSGFVLGWTAREGTSAGNFYLRRFARVYPLHLLVLAVVVVTSLGDDRRGDGLVIESLLLVQAWFPVAEGDVPGINAVAWSLSCEAFFYLAFPLVWVLALRLVSLRMTTAATISVFGAGAAVLAVADLIGQSAVTYYHPVVRLFEFLLGVLLARAVRLGWTPGLPLNAAAALAGLMYVATLDVDRASLVNLMLAPCFALVVAAATGNDLRGRRSSLRAGLLQRAGEASFAFYLVHLLVLTHGPWAESGAVLRSVVAFVIAACLALLLHRHVERPARSWLAGLPDRERIPTPGSRSS